MNSLRFLAVLALLATPLLRAQTITYVDTDAKTSTQSIATNGTLTLQIASGSATESGVFSGAGGLIKTGNGTLTLTGSSTYTGGTTINAGTLFAQFQGEKGTFASGSTVTVNSGGTLDVLGDSLGWGDSPAKLVLNGGTLTTVSTASDHTTLQDVTMTGGRITFTGNGRFSLNGPLTTLASSSTATIDANLELLSGWVSGTTAFNVAAGTTSSGIDLDISGNLIASGPLVKNGAGLLRLSGANTYSGGTTLNAGTLLLASTGALGTTGTISLGGGTLRYSSANTTDYSSRFGTAASQQYRIDTNSQNVTLASALISSGGTLTKLGAGTLILSGNNTYSGGSALSAGTLALGSAGALGSSGTITMGGGILQYSSANKTDYSGRFSSAASQQFNIDTNGQNVDFATALTSTGGSLTKLGAGSLELDGNVNLSGGIALNAGTLALGTSVAINSSTTITFGGGLLQFASKTTVPDYSARFSTADNQPFNFDTNGHDVTLGTSLISSGGSLTKFGAGTLTVNGVLSLSSGIDLSGGTLALGGASSIAAGSIHFGGGTLRYGTSAIDYSGLFSGTPGQNYSIDTNGQNVTFASALTGSSTSLTKLGTGTLTLSANNSFDGGIMLNGGNVTPSVTGAFGSSGPVSFGGGTLLYSSSNTTDYSARFSPASNQQYSIDTNSQNVTLASALTSSGGTLTKLGAGTLTLSGNNTYTGGTTLTGGTLALGSAGALGSSGPILMGGGLLQYSAANTTDYSARFSTAASQQFNLDTNGQDVAFGSNLTSTGGSLTKLGSGTLTLSGSNAYTGATFVSGGTLTFATSASLGGTSGLQVAAGATAAFKVGGTGEFSASTNFSVLGAYDAGSFFGIDTSDAPAPVTFAGALSGPGVLRKLGTGTLILSGASTNLPGARLDQGTLSITGSLTGASGTNGTDGTATVQAAAGTTLTVGSSARIVGGTGGDGVSNPSHGGNGGQGATAAIFADHGTLVNAGLIEGGSGGAGGSSSAVGGAGGQGGDGVDLGANANVTNQFTGSIQGNNGGPGGVGNPSGNPSGIGTGVSVGSSGTVVNAGLIGGGTGVVLGSGSTLTNSGTGVIIGESDAAVRGSDVIIVNSGILSSSTNAVVFSGTANTLELQAGSQISGHILAGGSADTLILGGATDAGFDLSQLGDSAIYRNFEFLTKNGSSTWTLTGTSPYTGTVTVAQGALQLGDGTTGGVMSAGISNQTALVFNPGDTSTYAGAISGSGTVTKIGSGLQILSGANTATGLFTVAEGTLQFANPSSLINGQSASWDASHLSVASGATAAFNVGGTGEFGATDIAAIAPGIFQAGSFLGLDTSNASSGAFAYDGNLTGPLGLAKLGAGTLTLGGINTYAGTTAIYEGVVEVSAGNQLGSAAGANLLSFDGGTLRVTGDATFSQALTFAADEGTIEVADGRNAIFSGAIDGPGRIIKTGSGTLTLSGSNTLASDLALDAGTLVVTGSLSTAKAFPGYVSGGVNVLAGSASNVVTGADGTTVNVAPGASITAGAGGDGYSVVVESDISLQPIYDGGTGGRAVTLGDTATLNNQGTISGGGGGTGTVRTSGFHLDGIIGAGGDGGTAVQLGDFGTVLNGGTIKGGAGGSNASHFDIGLFGTIDNGGQGGVGLDLGNSGSLTNTGTIIGGDGGATNGTYVNPGFAGAGGNGGNAAFIRDSTTVINSGSVFGGNGGLSGGIISDTGNLHGTSGGNGGSAFAMAGSAVTLNNSGTIQGGNGGAGTSVRLSSPTTAIGEPGDGGQAGSGVSFGSHSTLINTGTIQGGNGGAGGDYFRYDAGAAPVGTGADADGGVAVGGSSLYILNSGLISGGLSGDGVTRGDAIAFSGSGNTLELQGGSSIIGDVIGATKGGTNVLILSGTTPATLLGGIGSTGQYQNFTGVQKNGTGNWTLTADGNYTGPTTISGGTLQFGSGGTTGSLGSGPIVNNATLQISRSNDLVVGNDISGSGNLSKFGAGNLTLNGTNTYSGTTDLFEGTVTFGTPAALSGNTTLNFLGGTLGFGADYSGSVASQFSAGVFQSYKVDTGGHDVTFTTGLGGDTDTLTKLGGGTLTLGAAGDFSSTTLSGGTLAISATSQFTTGLLVFNGGTLLSSTSFTPTDSLVVIAPGGELAITGGQTVTLANGISGAGALTKSGAGTLLIATATNSFQGSVHLTAGTLALGLAGTLQRNALIVDGGTVDFGSLTSQTFGSLGGSGNLVLSGAAGAVALTVGNDFSNSFDGALSGPGSLTKAGNGTFTLIGVNTYAGPTTINGGILSVSNDNQLGGATSNLILGQGTLETTVGLTSARTITATSYATIQVDGNQTSSFSTFGGTGNLNKTGTGTLTFGLPDGAAGQLYISAGTLNLRATDVSEFDGVLTGPGDFVKSGAGTLIIAALDSHTGSTTIAGGTLQFGNGAESRLIANPAAAITDNGVLAFDHNDLLNYSGTISGSGAVTKDGTGTLTLSGTNSYLGGTTVSGGTLMLGNDAALGGGGVTINLGGTLDLGSRSLDTSLVSGTGRVITSSSFAFTGSGNTNTGLILAGTAGLSETGTGTVTLSGASSYSGGTDLVNGTLAVANDQALGTGTVTLDGGTLEASGGAHTLANALTLNNDSTIGGSDALTLTGPLTLARNRDLTIANTAITTFTGAIGQSGGARALLKYGAGELRLTGASTYTGGTLIAEGTVRINNLTGSAFGTGAVTVEQGATLAGSGFFTGALQLNGTLSPGNSPGTTHSGSEVWAGGAGYIWQINNGTGIAGVNYDLADITGTLTIDADATTPFAFSLVSLLGDNSAGDVANFDATRDHQYTLATASLGLIGFNTAGFTIDASAFTNDLHGGSWSIEQQGHSLNLVFTAVPEPAAWAVLAGLAALACAIHRRRKS